MKEALLARLIADAGIAAATDEYDGDPAVFWAERPKPQVLPAIVLHQIAPGLVETHDGFDPLTGPWVQADCMGRTYDEATILARALKAALPPEAIVAGRDFKRSFLLDEADMGPEDQDGGGKVFRVRQDWRVWSRPAP